MVVDPAAELDSDTAAWLSAQSSTVRTVYLDGDTDALPEGITLSEMQGFGGRRPWSDVSTVLAPFLDHPDDHGDLSAADCAAMLPQLEAIASRWLRETRDPLCRRHIDDVRQLAIVLRLRVEKAVKLQFG